MKKCSVCEKTKSEECFRRYVGASPDGLRPLCMECQKKYEKSWRAKSKEKLRKARWIRSPKAKEYARRYRAERRAEYLVAEVRRRSARKGIPFDLDKHVQEINARIKLGLCELTGYPMNASPLTVKYERRADAPSIDRIDPDGGYLYGNIRIVCLAMNTALGPWGEDAFLPIAKAWIARKEG